MTEEDKKKPFTLFNNETGQSVELPVLTGTDGPDVLDIRNLYKDTGLFTYDPGYTSTASCNSAITFICSGVVPQQPPMILTQPSSKNFLIFSPICDDDSSYSPKAFGSPAFGKAAVKKFVNLLTLFIYGNIRSAPNAQLNPIVSNGRCESEVINASVVWPERVLPLASVMVPLTIIGIS